MDTVQEVTANKMTWYLYRAADRFRLAYEAKDPEARKQAASELLRAARDWRQAARDRNAEQGLPDRARPAFANVPRKCDRTSPPSVKRHRGILCWWASKYAWDKADGDKEATRESGRQLLRIASVRPVKGESLAAGPKGDQEWQERLAPRRVPGVPSPTG